MGILADVALGWSISVLSEWSLHALAHVAHPLNFIHSIHELHHRRYRGSNAVQPPPYTGDYGAIAFGPCILLLWSVLYVSTRSTTIVATTATFLFVSDYLHTQFHVQGSWLEGWDWFRRKRREHMLHHRRPRKNMSLGGLSTLVDRMLGTFLDPIKFKTCRNE
jgi:sterol desaturase/sphingolipid hydroxylase (fatty acid hydroxylase superfamily)